MNVTKIFSSTDPLNVKKFWPKNAYFWNILALESQIYIVLSPNRSIDQPGLGTQADHEKKFLSKIFF